MNSSTFSTINPATGQQIKRSSFFSSAETEGVLVRADKTFQSFRKSSVHQRARLLSNLAATLRRDKSQLAKVITIEMGKILSEAEAEVEKQSGYFGTQIVAPPAGLLFCVQKVLDFLRLNSVDWPVSAEMQLPNSPRSMYQSRQDHPLYRL
jgi:hypothetical protein